MNYQSNNFKTLSITKILISINVIIFVLMYVPFFNLYEFIYVNFVSSGIMEVRYMGINTISSTTIFENGNFYRLLTANFLHGGPTHLIMNMMGLYILGEPTESMIGKKKFILMYIVSALCTTLLCAFINIWFNPNIFEPVIGASGAVLGIGGCLAGMALYRKFFKIHHIFEIDYQPLLVMLGLNIALGLVPGISFAGHLGGILGGCATGFLYAHIVEVSKGS
jgi:rhomboid protease GluP